MAPPAPPLDVLVIGGGVHGAAIARDAAHRGLRVELAERHDFASGTSSRSSKLAHGGLRYLEQLRVGMVRESLRERDRLLLVAPHLCWPLPFLIPLSGPAPRSPWMVRLGLLAYDLLAGGSRLPRHRVVEAADAVVQAPGLEGSGALRLAEYHDAGMDDMRLVIELVLDAHAGGARCRPHVQAVRLLRDGPTVRGAVLRDATGRDEEVRARVTVLACGPWTAELAGSRPGDQPRLILTKGTHVFVRRPIVTSAALFLATPQDGRVFFVIPWKGGSLIGTTDTPFSGAPDRARADAEDVRYLLDAVRACLPATSLGPEDVVATQAGVRPLVATGRARQPSRISRDFRLDATTPGLVVVEGGKYTIFRKLAEDLVDRIARTIANLEPSRAVSPCVTRTRPLPGAVNHSPDAIDRLARDLIAQGVPDDSARLLVGTYGMRARAVVAAAEGEPRLLRPACDEHPHLPVQAIVAVRDEMARTPADALLRRLDLGWWPCGGRRCAPRWAESLVLGGLAERDVAEGMRRHEEELEASWRPAGG